MEDIPLPSLFHRALTTAAKAVNLPTIQDETQVRQVVFLLPTYIDYNGLQELNQSALDDLRQCSSRVAKLSLFSANEQLADIPTRDLAYILVPYALSEVLSRVRATDREERLDLATNVKVCIFVALRVPGLSLR